MKRRKFIKSTFSRLPILFLTPTILTQACGETEVVTPNGKTVVIIGAGISGLAAAKSLKEKGFNVVVLESQEKIGGRLRTNRSLGIAFDEGASWIHGINGNPITALAQKAGMNTFHTVDDQRKKSYDIGGVLRTESKYQQTEDEYYEILETLMNSGNKDKSFETVFNSLYPGYATDRLWQFFLSTYITE